MGHGSGEEYITKKHLDSLHKLFNINILMGCGSVKLTDIKTNE